MRKESLCSKVMRGKYERGLDLRRECKVVGSDSILWKELTQICLNNTGGVWGMGEL